MVIRALSEFGFCVTLFSAVGHSSVSPLESRSLDTPGGGVSIFLLFAGAVCVSVASLFYGPLSATSLSSASCSFSMVLLSHSVAFWSSHIPAFVLLEGVRISRSIGIVFGTTFPLMVSVCRCTLIVLYGLHALGINLLNVGLFVVNEPLVFIASASLSTNTSSIGFKAGVCVLFYRSCTCIVFGRGKSTVNDFC